MNPLAIGVDVVDVERVERMLARHGDRVLARVLTEEERLYCEKMAAPARHVAARLAAKEAAYKALAIDDEAGWIGWLEVEVRRDGQGRPQLSLHGRAQAAATRLGVRSALVTLTHSEASAVAVVLLVGDGPSEPR
jgi:holo-[acyl-carrier protein] synthase